MSTIVPGYGDTLPKLLLVNPRGAEPRLLHALYRAGIAARDTDRLGDGQKLFGARIVADPADEWAELQPWVRAVVAFGPDPWTATVELLSVDGLGFAHAATATSAGERPVTILGCLGLEDEALTDAMLARTLASAQQAAGLTWACGGSSVPRKRQVPPARA
ncbi:hypothetical protein ACFYVR_10060 [Rhodococcus sp. NPDC003318]|uniref:hypothetical protein n=1 Tax=Rhodococcus sp. NPDC003318 TaxID=3364503 RepID=UPI00369ED696